MNYLNIYLFRPSVARVSRCWLLHAWTRHIHFIPPRVSFMGGIYTITFNTVDLESLPLLMAKAVSCSAHFWVISYPKLRTLRRRNQSLSRLSFLVVFFCLFVFQYTCTGTLLTLCKSARSKFAKQCVSVWGLRSSFRGCKNLNHPGEGIPQTL